MNWSIEKIILELKYTWKLSRNAADEKTNLVVTLSDGEMIGQGESAPNIRYNELPDELINQFGKFQSLIPEEILSMDHLDSLLNSMTLSNALRFGIESAYIHFECEKKHQTVPAMLEIAEPPPSLPISFSIPVMDIGKMKEFYESNRLSRFPFIKLKIDSESGTEAIGYLSRFCSQPLIVDANEAFKDVEACIYFLEGIKKKNIEFIEQPLPSTFHEESIYLKKYSTFRLFADESITADADFGLLKQQFHGVNIKLMKAAGYLNAVRLLREAKKHQLQTMIGCMVETTLGISSAYQLASLAEYHDLDSFLLVKNEPYGMIEELNGSLSLKK